MTNPPDEPQIHTEILGSPLMTGDDRDEPPTDTFHQDLIDETAPRPRGAHSRVIVVRFLCSVSIPIRVVEYESLNPRRHRPDGRSVCPICPMQSPGTLSPGSQDLAQYLDREHLKPVSDFIQEGSRLRGWHGPMS